MAWNYLIIDEFVGTCPTKSIFKIPWGKPRPTFNIRHLPSYENQGFAHWSHPPDRSASF
jgi:hypothetical protein